MGEFSLDVVDKATSCYRTGYQFTKTYNSFKKVWRDGKSYQVRKWDGKIHLLSVQTQIIPTGMVPVVIAALEKVGTPVEVEFAPEVQRLPMLKDVRPTYGGLTPRPYQLEAVAAVVEGGPTGQMGLLQLPTGSGKNLVASIIADIFDEITVVLVHGQQLVDQTRAELARFLGEPVGILMGEEFEVERVTVASVDSVAARLTGKKDPLLVDLLKATRVLIADEAHRVGGGGQRRSKSKPGTKSKSDKGVFLKAMDACPAPVRLGMSGTPFKKSLDTDLLLLSRTGPLLYDLTPARLQEEGHLSRADLVVWEVAQPTGGEELAYRDALDELVIDNDARTGYIVKQACYMLLKGEKKRVLIVAGNSVKLTRALEAAWEHLKKRIRIHKGSPFPAATFVTGSSGRKKVNAAVDDLREGRIQLLCSTVLFDEGTDVPALDALILAWPTKSFVRVMQRIGRGLRPKEDGAKLLVVDVFDNTNPYLTKHFYKRLSIYERERLFDQVGIEQVNLDGYDEWRYKGQLEEAHQSEPEDTAWPKGTQET